MKKIVNFILAMTVVFSGIVVAMHTYADDTDTVIAEIQIVSDTHVQADTESTYNQHFQNMLEDIALTSPNSSGLFIVGDAVDNVGATTEDATWSNLKSIYQSVEGAPQMYQGVGNHEFYADTSSSQSYEAGISAFYSAFQTGNTLSVPSVPYYDTWIKGYHFIMMGSENSGSVPTISETQFAWLEEKLAEGEDGKPIFLMIHQPIMNTTAGSSASTNISEADSARLNQILEFYPQTMLFAGHTHAQMSSDDNMWTEGSYTAFNTSSVAYLNTFDANGEGTANSTEASEGYYIYIYEDRVEVKGRDFLNQTWHNTAQYTVNNKDASVARVGDGFISVKYTDVTAYRTADANIAPSYSDEDGEWMFAGWYQDVKCTKPYVDITSETTLAYAKFVPQDVLQIKCQLTANTSLTSEKTNMRLVSSVDSLLYSQVGFHVYYNGNEEPIEIDSTTVYQRIVASATSGVDYKYSAKLLDVESEYFITATLINIANGNFNNSFHIKPYWTTMDGTTVYGISRYVRVSDALNQDNINLTVNVSEALNQETLTVSVNGTSYDASVLYQDETYAHLNITVPNRDAILPSLSKVTVTDGSVSGSTEYRNLMTVYDGTAVSADYSWYDIDADKMVIATSADLYGFATKSAEASFVGQTVYLVADMEANEGSASLENGWIPAENANEYGWTPIGSANAFGGTFDGQGHTISGIYYKGSDELAGLFGDTAESSTITNFTLLNSYFESTYATTNEISSVTDSVTIGLGSIAGSAKGTFDTIKSEAIIVSDAWNNGGIAGVVSWGNANFTNCWFGGTVSVTGARGMRTGGVVGRISAPNYAVQIDNCLNTGIVTTDSGNQVQIGGICGLIQREMSLSIRDCLVTQAVQARNNGRTGEIIGHMLSTNAYTFTNVHAVGSRALVGTLGTGVPEPTLINSASSKTDITGTDGWYNTGFDFGTSWDAMDGGTPQLKSFSEGSVLSVLPGRGTETNPWMISDADELKLLSTFANSSYDFNGKFVSIGTKEQAGTLTISINEGATVDEVKANAVAEGDKGNWTAIGSSTMKFAGTFDGNGNTISGLYLSTGESYQGLFGYVKGATIKNFALKTSYLEYTGSSNAYLASIAGYGAGTFQSLKSEADIVSSGARHGGIIGGINGASTISDCWYSGTMDLTGGFSGGIVGMVDTAIVSMENCLYTGTITGDATTTAARYSGLCGNLYGTSQLTIDDCLSIGTLISTKGSNWMGPIVGYIDGTASGNATLIVNNTYSNATAQYAIRYRQYGTVTCDGNIVSGGNVSSSTYANTISNDDILGYDAWYNNTSVLGLDFANYWCLANGTTPQLISFTDEADRLPMLDGQGTETNPWLIANGEDLSDLAVIAKDVDFSGKYVCIGTETEAGTLTISINEGTTVDEVKANAVADNGSGNWTPIGGVDMPFAGTFNGNGNTISGLYYKGADTYVGLFGNISNEATIKNFKLTNSYLQNTSTASTYMGSIVGCTHGTVDTVMSDAVIEAKGQAIGGLAGGISNTATTTGTIKFTNCWFNGNITLTTGTGRQSGGIVGLVDKANAPIVIEHCLNTGEISATRADAYTQLGGICGLVNRYSSFTISDTLNAEVVQNSSASTGSVIGKIVPTTAYTINDVYGVDGLAQNETTYDHVIVGTGGTVSAESANYSVVDIEDAKGTDVWYKNTLTLDFVNYWDPVVDGTPELKAFSSNGVGLWNGQGTQSSPWIITNKAELELLSSLAQSYDFSGKYFQLGTAEQAGKLTITVNAGTLDEIKEQKPKNWTPIGTNSNGKRFAGTFDGNGNTISGLYYNGSGTGIGLFGTTANNAEVKNLKITNSYFESNATGNVFIGSVAGYGYGTFKDIKSKAEVVCYGAYGSGLVGGVWTLANGYADFDDCWFDGTLRVEGTTAQKCGAILGGTKAKDRVDMTNCLNSGTILISKSNTTAINVGGFCGMVESNLNITNSLNVKSITINRGNVSAILGNVATGTITLTNVYAIEGDGPDQAYNTNGYYGILGTTYSPVVNVENDSWDTWRKSTQEELRGDNSLENLPGLFGTDTHWVVGDLYPILNMAGETYDAIPQMSVSTTENTTTKLTGDGNFVTTVTGTTKANYDEYLSSVSDADFVKVADNAIDDSVYSTTYKRDELVLCVTHFSKTSETTISYYEGAVSEHLVYDAEEVAANTDDAVTTMSMMELFAYGNSFVIQLKNGHFLISDGGMECELLYLLDYLDELTPGDATPVVDGWFITHAHEDHCGALNAFYDDASLASRIYVEGVYYSSPNDEIVLNNSGCESKDYVLSRVVKGILRDSDGEPTELYRPQTGQRYYFNDMTIDILLAQEQLSVENTEANITYRSNLNSSSTVSLLTSDGQTGLFAGDLQETGFDVLFANYSETLFSTLDFFALNHHGFNTSAKIASMVTANTVLLTVRDKTPVRCETAIKTLIGKASESMAWGNGTVVFTFPYEAGTSSYIVLPSKETVGEDGNNGWIYNVGETREEQPNLEMGTDGTTSEDWE